MSIVAISETTGSLGNEIGRRVSERLGYRFADREIIAKAAEQFGAELSDLRHGTEEKPSFWERLTDSQHRYRAYVDSIILEMASGDDVVLTGLAAAIVLRQAPHALRVRTNAPERMRANRLEQQQGLTREAALDLVRHTDHERATRVKFLYRVNVDDQLLYDLVLNTERLTADEGARLDPGDAAGTTLPDDAGRPRSAHRPEHRDSSQGFLHGEPCDRPPAGGRVRPRWVRLHQRQR